METLKHYKEIHANLIPEYERMKREIALSDNIDQTIMVIYCCLSAYLTALELCYAEDIDG